MKKFDRNVNLALEYLILISVYGAIVAGCCGYWWQLLWVMLVPLWGLLHRENYGKHWRSWMEWLLEFLLAVRVSPNGWRSALRWSPIAWVVVLALGLVRGLIEAWEFIKDELIVAKKED